MGKIQTLVKRPHHHCKDLPTVQFTYVASVLDPSPNTYEAINKMLRSFVSTGSTIPQGKGNWINQDILYGPKSEGGFNFIHARSFFMSLKISWIKRYATDRLDDHWADIIDRELKISRGRRTQILTWGTEALTDLSCEQCQILWPTIKKIPNKLASNTLTYFYAQ